MNEVKSNTKNIYIPITNYAGHAIKIDLSGDLPNSQDVVGILKAELAPLEIWLKLAIEYYNEDRHSDFLAILENVLDPTLEEFYKDSKSDRIAMLTALASYSTQLGANEKDKNKKDEHYNKAVSYFNKAIRIDSNLASSLTLVGRAILHLYKNEIDLAYRDLSQVVNEMSQSDSTGIPTIPAKIGYACLLFNKGIYQKALEQYQKIIEQNPNYSAETRLGLAYCYFKLGRENKAKESFQRVLELDKNNVEALIGLATIHFNQHDVAHGIKLISKAYELAPTNSVVLNYLANHFFHKGDINKTINLAQFALQNTEVTLIKAESYYQLGRAYHALEKWPEALKNYINASSKSPEMYLAHYGLGQIYICTGEYDKAISKFEQVLIYQPNSYETLQVLGKLYKQSSNQSKELVAKTKSVLKKVTELNPNDYDNWIELAQTIETSPEETTQALDAYTKAVNIMKSSNIPIPAEVLNNIAVLKHQKALYNEVEQLYLDAILKSGYQLSDYRAENITTTYNLARLYETKGQTSAAVDLYKGILKEHPTYLDCYLRLGTIAQNNQDYYEAGEWFKDSLLINPNYPEAWAMLGNLHQIKEEWFPAQRKLEQILEAVNKNETYASVALGNIYYKSIQMYPDKYEKNLGHAENYFKRVLQKSPNNIYAANGIGIISVEKGNLTLGTEIFVQIRESAVDVIPVSVNLAHVKLATGMYEQAIKLYEGCIKKIPSSNQKETLNLLLYLSKAFFEAKRYVECKQTLKKALALSPSNPVFQYNLAVTVEQFVIGYLEKPIRNLEEFQLIREELEQAKQTLHTLFNAKINPKAPIMYSITKSKAHYKSVDELLNRCNDLYNKDREEHLTIKKQREEAFELEQKIKEEKRIEDERIEMEIKRKKEEDLKKAEELQQMGKEHYLTFKQQKEEESKKSTPSKKRKPSEEDNEFIEKNDSGSDNSGSERKKKKEKKERKEKRKEKRRAKKLKRSERENREREGEEEGEEEVNEFNGEDNENKEDEGEEQQLKEGEEEQKDEMDVDPKESKVDDDDELFGSDKEK